MLVDLDLVARAVAVWAICSGIAWGQSGPMPGEIYREYARHNGGSFDWRVTDEQVAAKFAERTKDFLPNPRLPLRIDDLKGAVRAEALLDRWGGHRGTINKRIRFNGHEWIAVPEIQTAPAGIRPEMLMFQDNPVVAVPLADLKEGENFFEGDCDERGGFGWGQWGIYSLILRVYYDPAKKGGMLPMTGRIVSPAAGSTFGEAPAVDVEANCANGVARIDVVASYDGYDENGDGMYTGWHESRFQMVRGEANELRDHVGTLWKEPYRLTWNTHWIPDQPAGGIKLMARIQDSRGYWTVTQPVENLTLKRDDVSVKLYRAQDVPEEFGVRAGKSKSCRFEIPAGDDLSNNIEAGLHLRTWHGWDTHHEPLRINDFRFPIRGKNHHYDYDLLTVPVGALRPGENTFTVFSKTEEHHLEVLWPGPGLVVRYAKRLSSQ